MNQGNIKSSNIDLEKDIDNPNVQIPINYGLDKGIRDTEIPAKFQKNVDPNLPIGSSMNYAEDNMNNPQFNPKHNSTAPDSDFNHNQGDLKKNF
jgi:hypothetical protein